MLTRLYIIFSDAQWQLTAISGGIRPKFELIKALMIGPLTCKNEEDRIKNEGARVQQHFSHNKFMGFFSDAQGQITPQSVVGPGQISNSYDTLWLSLLPARMKKIQSKMKALEC